jgi:hypothetical protein
MKYLKEYKREKLFWEINLNLPIKKIISFDSNKRDKKDFISYLQKRKINFKEGTKDNNYGRTCTYYMFRVIMFNTEINFFIYKLEDDYYLVRKNTIYVDLFYKCDQIDGLISCIDYLL